jgi:glutaredoxin
VILRSPIRSIAFFTVYTAAMSIGLNAAPPAPVDSAVWCDSLIKGEIKRSCGRGHDNRKPPCALAVRLKRFADWLEEKEKPCSTMINDVAERSATLRDTGRYSIDTSLVTFVGASAAPVRIVMYVSASCPLCKRIYHDLYDSVTTGPLKGKARLGIKPFSSKPWDVALLASRTFGKQSVLLRSLANVSERISLAIILQKADSLGIPRKEFEKAIVDERIKDAADGSYREAVRNGVSLTPTLFIDNHRYKSYKDPRWVVDAAEYFHEREQTKR